MNRPDHVILGIHLHERQTQALKVQQLLTEYGPYIKTRIGLHDVGENYTSPGGLILVEVIGENAQVDNLTNNLAAIEGVDTQKMVFKHE